MRLEVQHRRSRGEDLMASTCRRRGTRSTRAPSPSPGCRRRTTGSTSVWWVPFPRVVIHYCEINAQVTNEVATLTAQTRLIIEKTTPHAPSNVTVTRSIFDSRQKYSVESDFQVWFFVRKETFAVTIEWLPGYSGCSHCEQTYKIR